MSTLNHLTNLLPTHMRRRVEPILEALTILRAVDNPSVLSRMIPSMGRGFFLRLGRRGVGTDMLATHSAHFDWTYASDFPEMRELYTRAKQGQWDGDNLAWDTDVDPFRPDRPLIPDNFFNFAELDDHVKLSAKEKQRLTYSLAAWMLSQFLHGEQGALFAAAQVTESVQWMDGKLYGATQVVDEGRHVEVFHRYLDEKLNKLYVINDNLFVIVDSLMTDSRWDMKFLGMQIMVEGLALGAFGTLYKLTREPLLKELLGNVIQDEARHVHYGVLALQQYIVNELSEGERREREDWSFEVALLMRNRFMAHEVYEEWFEGIMARKTWNQLISNSEGMGEFRNVMFRRLVPNLEAIGLLSPRIQSHYERAGLLHFRGGKNATELSAEELLSDLDGIERVAA